MIRQISLVLLLASSFPAPAQPLYKWTETDGSITFSPNPPPKGIEYEKINGEKQETGKDKPTVPSLQAASPIPAVAPISPEPENAPGTELRYGISRETDLDDSNAPTLEITNLPQPDDIEQQPDNVTYSDPMLDGQGPTVIDVKSNKQNRCQDLRKRVVSLERRLRSRLTPEDMDNTVIHMARYQRSFDQHCVQ